MLPVGAPLRLLLTEGEGEEEAQGNGGVALAVTARAVMEAQPETLALTAEEIEPRGERETAPEALPEPLGLRSGLAVGDTRGVAEGRGEAEEESEPPPLVRDTAAEAEADSTADKDMRLVAVTLAEGVPEDVREEGAVGAGVALAQGVAVPEAEGVAVTAPPLRVAATLQLPPPLPSPQPPATPPDTLAAGDSEMVGLTVLLGTVDTVVEGLSVAPTPGEGVPVTDWVTVANDEEVVVTAPVGVNNAGVPLVEAEGELLPDSVAEGWPVSVPLGVADSEIRLVGEEVPATGDSETEAEAVALRSAVPVGRGVPVLKGGDRVVSADPVAALEPLGVPLSEGGAEPLPLGVVVRVTGVLPVAGTGDGLAIGAEGVSVPLPVGVLLMEGEALEEAHAACVAVSPCDAVPLTVAAPGGEAEALGDEDCITVVLTAALAVAVTVTEGEGARPVALGVVEALLQPVPVPPRAAEDEGSRVEDADCESDTVRQEEGELEAVAGAEAEEVAQAEPVAGAEGVAETQGVPEANAREGEAGAVAEAVAQLVGEALEVPVPACEAEPLLHTVPVPTPAAEVAEARPEPLPVPVPTAALRLPCGLGLTPVLLLAEGH